MADKTKKLSFRNVNGRKVCALNLRVDSELRPVRGQQPVAAENTSAESTGDGAETSRETSAANEDAAPGGVAANPDECRVRCRLLSAVDTWSWSADLGMRVLVRNGHDDGRALRQAASVINTGKRPVPLMWNHSMDMRDKAGIVINANWEDSTDIPPGVNADLVVNRQYDPRAATGLERGVIDATSLWWVPQCEMSHPDMDFWTFLDLMGMEVDGQIVGFRPVSCSEVPHHAMVPAGADEYSGPRTEHAQNAANAATHIRNRGGEAVENAALTLLSSLCGDLGIEVALSEGAPIPETLAARLSAKTKSLRDVAGRFNALTEQIQGLAQAVQRQGETLSSDEILKRLPERLEMAKHGDAFLANQRNEAVAWFDRARVDPDNPQNLSEAQKRERERLGNATDLQFLADKIEEFRNAAQGRFGDIRTSTGDDLPPGSTGRANTLSVKDQGIVEGVNAMFGRIRKEETNE